MDTRSKLADIGLTQDNSVVIGSGILSALHLRASNDIDIVVPEAEYSRLADNKQFTKSQNHGREILADELFEIDTSWGVLGKNQTFDDLQKQSLVIDGVCYITIEFLLAVKKSWLLDDEVRQKDIDDVELIEKYLKEQQ